VQSGAVGSALGAAVLTRPNGMPHEKNATSNRKSFIVAGLSLAEFGTTFHCWESLILSHGKASAAPVPHGHR
jgi:hypothetical protein